MDNATYATIKAIIIKYDKEKQFGQPHNFGDFHHWSRQFKHGMRFKTFVSTVQKMGVESVVKRFENGSGAGKLKRVLVYKPENDQYLKGDISIVDSCPTCGGTGIIKHKLVPDKKDIQKSIDNIL